MTSTAIGDFVRQGWRTVKSLPGVAKALMKAAPNLSRDARFLYRYLSEMPRTPFNRAISAHRVYATASLPLPEVRALAKSRGVTVNDIVLALSAGALRRYLAEHAALPEKAWPSACRPRSDRFGDAQLNNQVVFTLSRLPTDVAEPLPQLLAAKAAGQEAKNLFADMRDLVTTDISILAAPLVVMGLTRLWAAARGANYLWPFFNLVISNVPGPRQPFYCVGAPATHYFPISIPYHGCALNLTVQSYLDTLDFGLIACSETVPDAQRIADFIVDDFAALKTADADSARPDFVGKIALALESKPVAGHKPIVLGEAKPPRTPRPPKAEKANPLARNIDALAAATEMLRSRLAEKDDAPARPRREEPKKKPAAVRAKATAKRRRGGRPRRRPRRRSPRRPDRDGSPRRRLARSAGRGRLAGRRFKPCRTTAAGSRRPRRSCSRSRRVRLRVPSAFLAAAPFLASAPRGAPQAVIVLPGLGATDRSTSGLRLYLRSPWLPGARVEPRSQRPARRGGSAGHREPGPCVQRSDPDAGHAGRLEPRRSDRARGGAHRAGGGADGDHARQSVRRNVGDQCRRPLATADRRRLPGANAGATERPRRAVAGPLHLDLQPCGRRRRLESLPPGREPSKRKRGSAGLASRARLQPRRALGGRRPARPTARNLDPVSARRAGGPAVSAPGERRRLAPPSFMTHATAVVDLGQRRLRPLSVNLILKTTNMREAPCLSGSFRRRRQPTPILC